MAEKSRDAIKALFVSGNLNEGDFIDFADSHFNLVDDTVDSSLILDGSIGVNKLTASTLSVLNTPDGLTAWTVNATGDLLPNAGHFQDIGSVADPLAELHADDLFINTTATLPASTTIGAVTALELSYLSGVSSPIQSQIDSIVISGGGTLGHTHTQAVPSDLWTINHSKSSDNLVYILMDETNHQILPNDFRIIDINTVEFAFASPQLGRVNIIFY